VYEPITVFRRLGEHAAITGLEQRQKIRELVKSRHQALVDARASQEVAGASGQDHGAAAESKSNAPQVGDKRDHPDS
jgi:hypothetical protein